MQGFSIYPNTKMTPTRMVSVLQEFGVENMIINSACDWGVSDPLSVPKTVAEMRAVGMADEDIDTLVWKNPIGFFGRDGRGSLEEWQSEPQLQWTDTHDGNSVLRGQDPQKM